MMLSTYMYVLTDSDYIVTGTQDLILVKSAISLHKQTNKHTKTYVFLTKRKRGYFAALRGTTYMYMYM